MSDAGDLDEFCQHRNAPGLLANHVDRAFVRSMDAMLRPLGVSLAQLSPLLQLENQGPMLQRDLVQRSATAQPAMVASLGKLEAAGLISRAPHGHDRRAAIISLTVAGREVVEASKPLLVGANRQALAGFSKDEATTLVALMHRLIANLTASS